jgi:S-adenosylmethionine synthetase
MITKEFAEYVSPGHPDRLADAIAESIVEASAIEPNGSIIIDSKSLVGVEVAVHENVVFIDGRVALDKRIGKSLDFRKISQQVYRSAGYGKFWNPAPEDLEVITRIREEVLPDQEENIRPFSDDQNIVIGYATSNKLTNGLPIAHFLALSIGAKLKDFQKENSHKFGSDFKLLVDINIQRDTIFWNNLTISILHTPQMDYSLQFEEILKGIKGILETLEIQGFIGIKSNFDPRKLIVNGAGEFSTGGPLGDNGLSGKKLVIDHYGPSIPIGGGAMVGKDPWKIDRSGQLRARQLAKRLVKQGYYDAKVTLTWPPGRAEPNSIIAQVRYSPRDLWMDEDKSLLPQSSWFSLQEIVKSLELIGQPWAKIVLEGNFMNKFHKWEN